MDHLEGAGGGVGGGAGAAEDLAGSDAHDRRRALGSGGEDGVPHCLVDDWGVSQWDGVGELPVDIGDEGCPVGPEIEGGDSRGGGRRAAEGDEAGSEKSGSGGGGEKGGA